LLIGLNRLAQFVRQNEGRFVLAAKIAAQLKRAMALRAFAKMAIAKR
jgi:hypothetical protein